MANIVVESKREDMADLNDLARTIRRDLPGIVVTAGRSAPRRVGRKGKGSNTQDPYLFPREVSNPLEIVEFVNTVAVHVPWEALSGAAATVVVNSVKDWVSKQIEEEKGDRYEVKLFGPNGKVLAVVRHDSQSEYPRITTGPWWKKWKIWQH